jgi:hypothetical protein
VRIEFERDITSLTRPELQDADLIVGANGAFSWVRTENEDAVRHHHRLAAEPLHLVRHQPGVRQPVADLPRHAARRVLRPPLPLQPGRAKVFHEHLPGGGGRRHLAARRLRDHEPRGHHPPLRAGVRQGSGRPPHPVEQLLLAPVPRDLERALELRQGGADGRRAAHRAFLDRLRHAAGHGRRGGAGQGLPRARQRCARRWPPTRRCACRR